MNTIVPSCATNNKRMNNGCPTLRTDEVRRRKMMLPFFNVRFNDIDMLVLFPNERRKALSAVLSPQFNLPQCTHGHGI